MTFMAGQMAELGAHLTELLQQNTLILLLDGLNEIPTTQQKVKAERYLTDAHAGDDQAGQDDADKLFWRLASGGR